jgi:hypothetical protein
MNNSKNNNNNKHLYLVVFASQRPYKHVAEETDSHAAKALALLCDLTLIEKGSTPKTGRSQVRGQIE